MPDYQKNHGIVLRNIPFQERDLLLTLFTAEQGIVKLIVKGGQSRKRRLQALCSPLSQGEFIYLPGKGEIGRFRDGTLKNSFPKLREDYDTLKSAGNLLRTILKSQLSEKPAPLLYQSLERFLQYLPEVRHPPTFELIFYLKVLIHEGLLHLDPHCQQCGKIESEIFLSGGQSFCSQHRPTPAVMLTNQEFTTVQSLADSRSLEFLGAQHLSLDLAKKIRFYGENLERD